MVQTQVTTRPRGSTPRDNPGTTYGVGEPACIAASSSAGMPRIDFGSVVTTAAFANTPATKEAWVEESEVLTVMPAGFVASIEIWGMRRGCIAELKIKLVSECVIGL